MEIPRINVCPLRPSPLHLFFIKLALYVALHALICFVKIYHFTDVYIIYIFVWTSDLFLKLPGQACFLSFLPFHSIPHIMAIPHAFDPKRGREELF